MNIPFPFMLESVSIVASLLTMFINASGYFSFTKSNNSFLFSLSKIRDFYNPYEQENSIEKAKEAILDYLSKDRSIIKEFNDMMEGR